MGKTKIKIMCAPETDCHDIMLTMKNMGFTHIRQTFDKLVDITANINYDNYDDLGLKIDRLKLSNKEKIMQINYTSGGQSMPELVMCMLLGTETGF